MNAELDGKAKEYALAVADKVDSCKECSRWSLAYEVSISAFKDGYAESQKGVELIKEDLKRKTKYD